MSFLSVASLSWSRKCLYLSFWSESSVRLQHQLLICPPRALGLSLIIYFIALQTFPMMLENSVLCQQWYPLCWMSSQSRAVVCDKVFCVTTRQTIVRPTQSSWHGRHSLFQSEIECPVELSNYVLSGQCDTTNAQLAFHSAIVWQRNC